MRDGKEGVLLSVVPLLAVDLHACEPAIVRLRCQLIPGNNDLPVSDHEHGLCTQYQE